MSEDLHTLAEGGKSCFMLYNRVDLQIIVESNYSSGKPYILCYHLVALLDSLLNLCFQCRAPGKANCAAVTLGSHRASAGRFGREAAN